MVGDHGHFLPPSMSLYVAERVDLIQVIDRWVLREAI
jgi:EAL domain-containing protein (putative c-di-GMP-specific phosphodiesterase class I)